MEVRLLTEQFHVTLGAYITRIEQNAEEPVPEALRRIRDIVNRNGPDLSWKDAYDIEQQLVHLYDENTLKVELGRRLLEADQLLSNDVAHWYRQSRQDAPDSETLRTLLARLINDLQWRFTKNEAHRWYTMKITSRTEIVFIASVILFFGVVLSFVLPEFQRSGAIYADHAVLIPFVAIAGAFGASFSMMTSLRSRLAQSSFDDLKLNQSLLVAASRVLIGIGAGLVFYFFVRSGLLGGEAFPDFTTASGTSPMLGNPGGIAPAVMGGSGSAEEGGEASSAYLTAPEFAKLFAWCFLSGFSEKLVPNLLASTEARQTDSSAPHPLPAAAREQTQRRRPTSADQDEAEPTAGVETKRD
jgi:hypothetical protein